ncbi:MAG: hypothetical protein GHCLOJNM_00686 [bacterium]|nr:hypothetical protein [bacterium]
MVLGSTNPIAAPRGFTLIELLIVIAIILILIAIALPNFLEAQIRAKVARVNADLRTIATAMESYLLDWKIYPPDSEDEFDEQAHGLAQLTTPLKYLAALPFDVFVGSRAPVDGTPVYFEMASTGITPVFMALGRRPFKRINAFALYSHGPDIIDNFEGESDWPWNGPAHPCPNPGLKPEMGTHTYSPTNGTTSSGDIVKLGGQYKAGHWCLDWIEIRGEGFEHAE